MAMYEDGIFMPYLDDEAVDRIVRKGDHLHSSCIPLKIKIS